MSGTEADADLIARCDHALRCEDRLREIDATTSPDAETVAAAIAAWRQAFSAVAGVAATTPGGLQGKARALRTAVLRHAFWNSAGVGDAETGSGSLEVDEQVALGLANDLIGLSAAISVANPTARDPGFFLRTPGRNWWNRPARGPVHLSDLIVYLEEVRHLLQLIGTDWSHTPLHVRWPLLEAAHGIEALELRHAARTIQPPRGNDDRRPHRAVQIRHPDADLDNLGSDPTDEDR
jgi:hypothetical protein